MGLSVLLNLGALALVGRLWRPLPSAMPPAPPSVMLLTLLPPTPKVRLPAKPKPPPRPKPKPPAPRRMATPLPPAPHQRPRAAPVAAAGGGAPKPRPKAPPKPAAKFHPLARVTPDPDLPLPDKTVEAALPDDMDSANGMTPADPSPAKMPDTGKTDSTTPGTQNAAGPGSGQAGTGAGTASGPGAGTGAGAGLFGTHGSGGGGTTPRHIVYVLDISGSMDMTEEKFHGRKRIEQARVELAKQFKTLADGETFSLIAFSDEIHLFRRDLVAATPDTLQSAQNFLDALEPDGDTDLERALKTALAMPDVNVVVVITDGVPRTRTLVYSTPEDFEKLASRIDAADSAHVPIYAYGLLGPNPDGTDDSPEASVFLSEIAADSGGKFVEVKLDGQGP